jgi:hypothetical protein
LASGASDLADIVVGSNPQLTAPGVPPGTYYVRVLAFDASGDSAPSNEVVVVVASGVPSAPTDLVAQVSGTEVTLSWTAPPGGANGYWVEAGTAPGATDVANLPVGPTPRLVASNVPSGLYYVRVRGFNHAGPSAPSNEVLLTSGAPACGTPAPPVGMAVEVRGSAVTVSWQPSATPGVAYALEAGSAKGLANLGRVHLGSETRLATTAPGGTYFVRVLAIDVCGSPSPATPDAMLVVGGAPPIADAGADRLASVGAAVVLNGSGSSDLDGEALNFRWSLQSKPAGSLSHLAGAATVTPSLVVDVAGTYVLQLVVIDSEFESTADTVVVTGIAAAGVPIANAGPDQALGVGMTAQLDGSGSSDPNGDPLTFQWTLVSRPAQSAAQLNDPSAVRTTFLVDGAGTYVVDLLVSDGQHLAIDRVVITGVSASPGTLLVSVANYQLPVGFSRAAPVYVSGGDGNYTWSIAEGSLPSGLGLTSNVPPGVFCPASPAGCIVIDGIPTTIGIYPFTIRVIDGAQRTGTVAAVFIVSTRPTVVTTTVPAAEKNVPYATALQATGGDGVDFTWSIASGALPDGLTLASDTGQITGTPTRGGHFSFVAQVLTSGGAAQRSLGIAVAHGPVPPSSAIAVMRDPNQSCQLRQSQLTCWGDASDGWFQPSRSLPTAVAGSPPMRTILSNRCGLTLAGEAACWLGGFDQPPTLFPGASNLIALASYRPETCGLTTGGSVVCWVVLVHPDSAPVVTGPFTLAGHVPYASLADGNFDTNHKCALTAVGQAYCWGPNSYGELGDGTTTPAPDTSPVPVAGGHAFAALTVSRQHSCGVTTAGALYCWGSNERGSLGIGPNVFSSPVPLRVMPEQTFKPQLASNRYLTCAITTSGDVYCWGNVGIAFAISISSWTPQRLAGTVVFETVSVNHRRICGSDAAGAAYCAWEGPLGDGSELDSLTPVRVLVAPP